MTTRRRALLSVSDKTGVAELGRALVELGYEVVSTGGTARHLEAEGVEVTPVSEATGFPEILGGRVKTLHPRIHGGILADRRKEAHRKQLAEHHIRPVDLVAVNLYPFAATVARPGVTFDEAVEMIDIGGPTMLRAAAKNFANTTVLVSPSDYGLVIEAIRSDGDVPFALRRRLALDAFRHTAAYDATISAWLDGQESGGDETMPARLTLHLDRVLVPRYGENPHQEATVYRHASGEGLFGGFEQLQGKALSYNNLLDTDAARKMVSRIPEPAVVIVKHTNPCGVGRGRDPVEAYRRALACDPVSAFGSIVAVNRPLDDGLAEAVAELFVEVLVVPAIEGDAAGRLAHKKNLRILVAPLYDPAREPVELRSIDGGMLAQVPDGANDDPSDWTSVAERAPTGAERRALELAWAVVGGVKSNAIVIGGEDATLGIGAGQMSRVDAGRLAIEKARQGPGLDGPVLVAGSDAFFPFRDGLDVLTEAGVTAVVEPGGSRRDDEVIAAANERGVALLFTGRRHFRH